MEIFKELRRLNEAYFKAELYLEKNENPEIKQLLREAKALCFVMVGQCSDVMNNLDILKKINDERGNNPILLEDLNKHARPFHDSFIKFRSIVNKMSEFITES